MKKIFNFKILFVILILLYFNKDKLSFINFENFNLFSILLSYFLRIIIYTPFFIVFAIYLIITNSYFIKKNIYNRLVSMTNAKIVKHLGDYYNILILGGVGSGKTTFGKYLVDNLSRHKKNLLVEEFYSLQDKLSFINLFEVNNYIEEKFNFKKALISFEIEEFALNMSIDLNLPITKTIKFKYIENPLTLIETLSKYIEFYYYVYKRDSNVLSNISMKVNGVMAKRLKESYTQYKRKSDIPIEMYMVIFEDEQGVVNNSRFRNNNKKDSDDGKDIRYMLLRHPSKATNTNIAVGQVHEDVTSPQKRLYQVFLNLGNGKKENYTVFEKELSLLLRLKTFANRRYLKKINDFDKRISKFRLGTSKLSYIPIPYFFSQNMFKKYANKIEMKKKKYSNNDKNIYKKLMYYATNKYAELEQYVLLKRNIDIHFHFSSLSKDITNDTTNAYTISVFLPTNDIYPYFNSFAYNSLRDKRNYGVEKSILTSDNWEEIYADTGEIKKTEYNAIINVYDTVDKLQNNDIVTSDNNDSVIIEENDDVF